MNTAPIHPSPDLATLGDLIRRHASASAELTTCTTFQEMAAVLAKHLIGEGQFVSMNVFAYDKNEQFAGFKTFATANRHGAYQADHWLEITLDELGYPSRYAVEDGQTIVLSDIINDPTSHPKLKNWNIASPILSSIIMPMRSEGRTFGIVNINSTRDLLNPSPLEINLYQLLADQIGALVRLHRLIEVTATIHDINERQSAASDELVTASDAADMVQIIARHMLPQDNRFLCLNEIVYGERGLITNWKALTTVNHERAFAWNTDLGLTSSDREVALHQTLQEGKPYNIANIEATTIQDIGNTFAEWMQTNNIVSCLCLPIVLHERVESVLVVTSGEKESFSQEEISAFSRISHQMGIALRIRHLLDETHQAQTIASSLVSTNRVIAVAESYMEMSASIMQGMPDTVQMVGILMFDTPVVEGEVPHYVVTEAIATRTELDRPRIVDTLNADYPGLIAVLMQLLRGEPVVIKDARDNVNQDDLLLPNMLQQMDSRGLVNFIGVGLRAGSQLMGIMIVGSGQNTRLEGIQLDNVLAVADQLSLTFENRRLLDQTAEALGFVQAQYETTNALYNADSPMDMLAALYAFTDGTYERAHLALIDADNPLTLTTIAEIDGGDIMPGNRHTLLSDYPDLQLPSETSDINDTESTITGEKRAALVARARGALLTLPLLGANRHLIGVVNFTSDTPGQMPFNRTRALTNLVDQLAVVLENRQLLRHTEEGLEEARILYTINRDLVVAQDGLEVLQALRKHLARDAMAVLLYSINWNRRSEELESMILDAVIDSEGERQPQNDLLKTFSPEMISQIKEQWALQGRDTNFIDDVAALAEIHPIHKLSLERGVASTIVIPNYEDNFLAQQVTILFNTPRKFDDRTRRLYTAIRDQIAVVLENQRLLRDTQTSAARLGSQVRVLQTINQLAANLTGVQDEATLLDQTCLALVNALRVNHANIALMDESKTSAYIVSEYPNMSSVGLKINLDNPLQIELRRELRPVVVDTLVGDPRLSDTSLKLVEKLGIKKLVLLPLLDTRGEHMGTVGLDIFDPNFQFDNDLLDIARTITTQVGVSLQNIRLLRDSQRQAQQFQQIAALGQLLQSTLEMEEILKIALTSVTRIVNADHASVLLFDAVHNRLQAIAARDGDTMWVDQTGRPVEIDGTTAGRVWRSGEAMQISDLSVENNLRHTSRSDMVSAMAQPIYSRGVVLGLVEIASRRRDMYDATSAALFQQLVSQLAVAMENAEAYSQSQQVAKSKALINDISTQLQRQVALEQMLDVTMSELGKALGAKRARIRLSTPSLAQNSDDKKTES